jgi:hypothetical protein
MVAGSDPGLTLVGWTDDTSASVVGGSTALRFLDVAPDLPTADFGFGTLAAGDYVPLVTGVPFATLAMHAGADAGAIDADGYLSLFPPLTVEVSAHPAITITSDLATASNQSLGGSVATIALVGGKTGGPPPHLLVCTEDGTQNESSGLYAACSIVAM